MKGAKKKKADTKLTVKKIAPKGKAPKDPNKPKRPASAFFVFMEAFRKQFKEENPTINSVAAEPFVAKAEQRKTAGISSVQSVISNNDIITEILLKLPILSLVLFKSVSKHWYSLIKEANITFRPNLDPLSGLFLKKISYKNYCESFSYDFVPLDIRISIYRSSLLATNFTFGPEVPHKSDDVEILDSCNGLLLCRTYSSKLYEYNPSITNMFKVLPQPNNVTYYCNSIYGGLRMAFDPTKSPHYKVIYAKVVFDDPDDI
nr:F-box protein At5g07610-like [Tanacetum cinerariifolium]